MYVGAGGGVDVVIFVLSTVIVALTVKIAASIVVDGFGSETTPRWPQLHVSQGTLTLAVDPLIASGIGVLPSAFQW